jgi:hypothetical protein
VSRGPIGCHVSSESSSGVHLPVGVDGWPGPMMARHTKIKVGIHEHGAISYVYTQQSREARGSEPSTLYKIPACYTRKKAALKNRYFPYTLCGRAAGLSGYPFSTVSGTSNSGYVPTSPSNGGYVPTSSRSRTGLACGHMQQDATQGTAMSLSTSLHLD